MRWLNMKSIRLSKTHREAILESIIKQYELKNPFPVLTTSRLNERLGL